jgi:hypothetical protein
MKFIFNLCHTLCSFFSSSDDLAMAGSELTGVKSCTSNVECGRHELCIPTSKHSGDGYCACQHGYARNSDNNCVLNPGMIIITMIVIYIFE